MLRVWFAPWEDSDGDLHDQSVLYLTVDDGEWLIEHNRQKIEDAYRPVHAPALPAAPPSDSNPTIQDDPLPASAVQTGSGEALTGIGVRQDRLRDEQAEDMLEGIQKPGDLTQ